MAAQVPGFPAPIAAETRAMPSHQRLGSDGRHCLHDRWKPPIQLEEEQAIAVRELDPTAHLALKHDQLTSERSILSLKSADRPERRNQQQPQKGRRAARPSWPTLRDSFTRSNGRGFWHIQVYTFGQHGNKFSMLDNRAYTPIWAHILLLSTETVAFIR